MGGTSADVGVVLGGAIRSAAQFEFEWGLPIAVPVVDLTTIGAGGCSIAGFDRGGLLQVGPDERGRRPGPRRLRPRRDRRDRHRREPRARPAATPTTSSAARCRSTADLARGAMQPVAERLGALAGGRRAGGHRAWPSRTWPNAVRLVVADRGLDYRRFDLVAFGGAGPLHAARARAARRARRRRRAAAPRPRVGVRRDRRRPARRPPPDDRCCARTSATAPALADAPAARRRRGAGRSCEREGRPGRADRRRQRRQLPLPRAELRARGRRAARRAATGSTSSPSSASTRPTRPRTATGCPTPWSSSCTSAPSRPTTARCRPTRRRRTARPASRRSRVRPVCFEGVARHADLPARRARRRLARRRAGRDRGGRLHDVVVPGQAPWTRPSVSRRASLAWSGCAWP